MFRAVLLKRFTLTETNYKSSMILKAVILQRKPHYREISAIARSGEVCCKSSWRRHVHMSFAGNFKPPQTFSARNIVIHNFASKLVFSGQASKLALICTKNRDSVGSAESTCKPTQTSGILYLHIWIYHGLLKFGKHVHPALDFIEFNDISLAYCLPLERKHKPYPVKEAWIKRTPHWLSTDRQWIGTRWTGKFARGQLLNTWW